MELDEAKTAGAFIILFAIIAVGTFMSPMTTRTIATVLGGLFIFGVITLLIGVKHGEYRAAK